MRSAPWLVILLLTGIVQFIRATPVDGVIFLLVALVATIDAVHPLPGRSRFGRASSAVTITVAIGATIRWSSRRGTPSPKG